MSIVQKRSRFIWLVNLYISFILFWLLLRLLFFDRLWFLAPLNTIAQYFFLPLPFLLIISAWRRQWIALLKLSVPTTEFIVLFGPLFLPPLSGASISNIPSVTAMSFNILSSNTDYEAIVASIQTVSPDLVGFQEVTRASATEIAKALAVEYPYHTLEAFPEYTSVALLSRFPIERADLFALPPMDKALHTLVNINGERIHVFVVHLSPNQFFDNPVDQLVPLVKERYGRRAAEVALLQKKIVGLEEPILLMCDCNLTDTSEAYARLNSFLNDSFREAGWGFGHTFHPPIAPLPIQRIDYVWHSDEFIATEAFVGQHGASDHLPIVAKLKLTETP